MLNNILSILERLGSHTQNRAIHITFSNLLLNTKVVLQRIDGYQGINEGQSAELICLATDPYIELKQFIGCQVAIDQVTDQGQLFRTTGIITGASQGQSDGAFSLFRLTLQDPTALWHKRRNSRVFMNKSVIEIIEIIFKEWQDKSKLFASSLKLDLSGLGQTYDVRPFSMQSSESDYAYLTRLMREESINWLIDESRYFVQNNTETIEPQILSLIDNNDQFSALTRRVIRYHRSNATEQTDSITSFIAQRQLQPTAIYVQRWQADYLSQEDGSGSVLSAHQHSSQQDNESLSLEQAWNISPAWIRDLKGEDQATASSNSQLEKLNKQLNQYQALQAKYFTAYSSVRDIQVGYWFQLIDHPEIEKNHSGRDKEFLVISKHYYNQNNFPKDIQDQVEKLLSLSHWERTKDSMEERQANQFVVIRRSIDFVPEYDPLKHRPTAYVQRAKVVSDGEEIYVDEWGRIKVRFLFTRADDHSHDGGAGSNDNDTDSAWVDVLTPWAGEGYGARFLPRKDEIVVIDFFDGNIDRPFVTGRIHEAERNPTKFDIKGQLPDTKKLSGIRSKEVGGQGFNQLRFDDTTGQTSTQLHSSHGATQLNLGNLSHPKEQAESDGRGEGFELRTDQWGAVRAGEGLLLSTYKQDSADGTHLDANQAKSQLESNLNNAQALSEVAKNQQTDPLEVLENIQSFIQTLEKEDPNKADEFKAAIMVLTSPNSIAVATNEDLYLSADGQMSQSAGDSINISTQKSLIAHAQSKISLFAAQDGFRAYAGKGKAEIHAHTDGIDVFARKGIQIISTEDSVEIIAKKKIILKGGESQLVIEAGGIFPTTPKLFESKAQQHLFKGGVEVGVNIQGLPAYEPYNEKFKLLSPSGEVMSNLTYQISNVDQSFTATTDNKGLSKRVNTESEENLKVDLHWISLEKEDDGEQE